MRPVILSRRQFLETAVVTGFGSASIKQLVASETPAVKQRRATDGDQRFEPDWDERISISVGTDRGDIVGSSDKALQAAIDYIAGKGGGTVRILPGTFTLRNALHLPSRIRLLGSGPETIITKGASETVALSEDSDWYDQEITLEKSAGFQVGDGVVLISKNPNTGSQDVIKRTLVARSGNRFKLNDGLRKNLWLSGKPTASSLFPLLTSEYTKNVVIENLTLDGNRKNNTNLNGNYGGCIFLQDCNRYTIRDVTTRNYNGDGISFQICHDVKVEHCHSHDNAGLGVHPGSGSQRPQIINSRFENNHIGLFWCWGVKYGLAEKNQLTGNNFGISIGHNDTDNIMRENVISNSGKVGILFRDDARGKNFWANRNTVVKNQIINSGADQGVAIDITGKTSDLIITDNTIVEQRKPMQRTGIRIGPDAGTVKLADNQIQGFMKSIDDQRKNT
ncbi:right-handed parallel beta-helix repeat-containing protein [Gimesia fumaroli]|uniref:Pectate lyase superfamily protein n=1 Tax=Gimesia fumaroli TaxID=2527976 RepID=A0A518I555_9PLAN|nr:right-handed parallel beta-helix repeat-containing protein [Gimesia fumaroli]QDV48230.1 Pectate lyase superfamily protein [Gimesia fumaroli]